MYSSHSHIPNETVVRRRNASRRWTRTRHYDGFRASKETKEDDGVPLTIRPRRVMYGMCGELGLFGAAEIAVVTHIVKINIFVSL